jgi:hypothetical protein
MNMIKKVKPTLIVAFLAMTFGICATAFAQDAKPFYRGGFDDQIVEAPKGHEGNWVQTLPGKSFNLLYRMYGPLEPWFDKSWKLGDFELVK